MPMAGDCTSMADVAGDDDDDRELLRRFRAAGDAAAFATLVERHLGWVYRSARRQVRDPALADDVAQAVFILLARRPPALREGVPLSPWLFRSTRNIALTAIRSEARRRRHEQRAASMVSEISESTEPAEWKAMAPHLDELIQSLRWSDRDVIVMRYLERRSLAELAQIYRSSEDACRKKVARATERLRATAQRRGLTAPAAPTLGAAMLADAGGDVPSATPQAVASKALSAIERGTGGLAAALAEEAVRSLGRSLLFTRAGAVIACIAVLATAWIAASQLAARGAAPVAAAPVAAAPSPLPPKTPGKLRVGYIVSNYTVTGPGRAFNGQHYSHAHSKVVPLLTDPTTELWAVIEPGTADDPGIAQIVQTVFAGRQMNGSDVAQLKTCDVIVAAGVRNGVESVLKAVETTVRESGVGLLLWIPIGGSMPGLNDPIMRRLNALDGGESHSGQFSLDWIDCDLVGTHSILGPLAGTGGKPGAQPKRLQFRPELLAPIAADATPLVRLKSEDPKMAYYPLYVSKLGRGHIVHFGFATFTQIPQDFDRAVGGRFTMRCLYWLAGRSPDAVPGMPGKAPATGNAHAPSPAKTK
jgi:RNA polymerase sigma-70 factor (ECF subfamily)